MKNKKGIFIISAFIIVVIAFILVFVLDNGMQAEAEYPNGHAKSIGEFTAKTTERLFKDSKENKCYSPLSLYTILCLVAETTEEDTREEILEALGVEDMQMMRDYYSSMQKSLKVYDDSVITLCNGMWVDETYSDENTSKVMDECNKKMNCELFLCDEIRSNDINSWVSDKLISILIRAC